MVPVVEGLVDVDALVALQADEPRVARRGEGARDLRLAHARLALQQQRLLERRRQVDGGRKAPVGEVALAGQGLAYGLGTVENQSPAASISARRVNTRAR